MKELSNMEIKANGILMLTEFDRIMNNIGVKYSLFGGTLLGAIRHNGYIPWDDDIDVCMLRNDYEKVINYAKDQDKNQRYLFKFIENENDYFVPFGKFIDTYTIAEEHKVERNVKIGMYIDIFPFDIMAAKTYEEAVSEYKSLHFWHFLSMQKTFSNYKTKINSFIDLLKHLFHLFSKIIPNKIPYYILKHKLLNKINGGKYLIHGTIGDRHPRFYDKNILSNIIFHKFEKLNLPITLEYDKMLIQDYGDYMTLPSINDRVLHYESVVYK